MQIDKQSLQKLLNLNDRQLGLVINKIAVENGIDPSAFNINPKDIESVRRALSSISDEDIKLLTQQYEDFKKNGGKGVR